MEGVESFKRLSTNDVILKGDEKPAEIQRQAVQSGDG